MRKSLKKYIDRISLVVSSLSMMLMFLTPDSLISKVLLFVAGLVGFGYLGYAAFLWWLKRVDFDWHLINGHFLRKVIILVISMPSTITIFISICSPESKELVFDNNLYKQCIEPQTDKIKTEETICVNDSVFITNFSSYYTNDIDKTLPDSIKTKQEDPPVFWTVYYHFIDPGNQHMTTTPSGRIWASLIAILGVFLLNGLLVSSIIGWIDSRKEKWQSGNLRYKLKYLGKYKFAVVIGGNEIAASVIKNLLTPKKEGEINYKCEGENDYVILQTSREVEDVRNELESRLSEDHLKKVIIYKALRDSEGELKKLHIEYATEVYILGETSLIDGGESYHDAINMKCVNIVARILNDAKHRELPQNWHRKVCKVLFEYQTTYSIFLFSDVSEEINKNLVFIPFNRCESWARRVMTGGEFCRCVGDNVKIINNDYMPLEGDGIKKDSDEHVHLIVVGMSKMGVAMGVQALLQAHYINYAAAEKEGNSEKMKMRRTRLTFIDSNADKEKNFFIGRYQNLFNIVRHRYIDTTIGHNNNLKWDDPMWHENLPWSHLNTTKDGQIKKGNFLDVEIEFVKGELESENVRKYLLDISNSEDAWVKNSKLTIAICLTQTHQAIAASLYMPISVYEKAQQVWVYQPDAEDIISNLKNTNQADKRYKKLRAFGMVDCDYMSNRSLYLKSILANAMYDLSDGNKFKDIDMGTKDKYKEIREMWKKLSIDKKFSNKYFVDTIMQKIRSIITGPFTLEDLKETINCEENKEILARCEHNRWNVQQLLLGYSPCPQNVDSEFQSLEMNKVTDSARQKRNELRERFAQDIYNCEWADLNPFQRQKLTIGDSSLCKDGECENMEICKKYAKYRDEYYKTPHGIFDKVKENYKTGENRMHANICSYDHLDVVDSGAKGYDVTLNSKISMFIEKVDLYTPSE